jgi:hypothetical protein
MELLNTRPASSGLGRKKANNVKRSLTAFEPTTARYSQQRAIYPAYSTAFAVRQKFLRSEHQSPSIVGAAHQQPNVVGTRSKSSVNNYMQRSYTTVLTRSVSRKSLFDRDLVKSDDEQEQLVNPDELIHPKRSVLTLARIGMVYFGIEALISFETALTVPILLKLDVPEQ